MVAGDSVRRVMVGMVALWLVALPAGAEQSAQPPVQQYFPSPQEAVQGLIAAVDADGGEGLLRVFGPQAEALKSGDEVADQAARQRFLDAAKAGAEVQAEGDDRAEVLLGPDHWPFPIPLVRDDQGWRFDTDAGLEELLNRRIGRNELYTIAVVRAVVDAQHEYAGTARDDQGPQYAGKFLSSQGGRDGLYWPSGEGEEESPLGPLIGAAVAEGYERKEGGGPQPYHGYFFRLLTAQGSHAPGGAMSYLEDGRLTRGFAVLAYPAEYGSSGIMSFIANQQGIVFQRDLGEQTEQAALATTAYDPDPGWYPVGRH